MQGSPEGEFSVSVGVPFAHVRWFRGRETSERAASRCPDATCCREAPAELSARWAGRSWPSARPHASTLAALPIGAFPGVDATEVTCTTEGCSDDHSTCHVVVRVDRTG